MPTFNDAYPKMVAALVEHYGQPRGIVTGLSRFEALVAVFLSRGLEPPRLDRALATLEQAGYLEPETLARAEPVELGDILKQAGLSIPAKTLHPLRRLASWFLERVGSQGMEDDLDEARVSTSQLREELAAINGIGLSTADALLLLGFARCAYPLDRATYRILFRHGWIDPDTGYDEASQLLVSRAHENHEELASLSTWLERIGRQYCRPGAPKCQACPLRCVLPEEGPRDDQS